MSCHVASPGTSDSVADVASCLGFHAVALVGPPNSGKTTLFNRLTGLRQKVGNFPGVTVEHHSGSVKTPSGRSVRLLDLPGVYGLSAKSEDERVAIQVLRGQMPGCDAPDGVVLVLDSTQLQRHLTFALQVIELGLPTLVVLNMADELRARGGSIDVLALARELHSPVALVSSTSGDGLSAVMNFLGGVSRQVQATELVILGNSDRYSARASQVAGNSAYRKPLASIWTKRLDALFLHRYFGPILLALIILTVFQAIFSVGQPLSNALQFLLERAGDAIFASLPNGLFRSLLQNGVWKGTTSVLVFLPQILLLFLVIGILEDSGYLARAAVTADRAMAKIGLNGKSFIPLLSAFGCAVPAIMATRTIESKRDRLATILIAPFMTCSARLPVYVLLIAAFVPNRALIGPFLGTRAAAMVGLYILGFVMAITTARLLKSTILKSKDIPFMMEMPPYRWPTLRSLGLRLLDRGKVFVVRAGTVIMAISVLLWIGTNLPVRNGQLPKIEDSVVAWIGHAIEPAIRPLGFDWKVGVGLITCVAARETIIATLGTLNGLDANTQGLDLQTALRHELTPAAAVALLVFFAYAMQCMATLAVVRRETNSWKWPAVQFCYMTTIAYISAYVVFQVLSRVIH